MTRGRPTSRRLALALLAGASLLATRPATAQVPANQVPAAQVPAAQVPAAGSAAASAVQLTRVAEFAHQVTGVAVSGDGRVFVNFPRWTDDAPVSVAEVKDGKAVPYPDEGWNAWRNARKDELSARDHFVCVQSVVADGQGRLWVVDAAAPAMAAVVKDGPKLVAIDLATNKAAKTIAFDETVAPQGSYLNDVRVSPDGKTAYLTDSGAEGALIVVDLDSGRARRVLAGDPSTMPDKSVTVTYDGKPLRRPDGRGVEFSADGIALSPDGATLYWQAIKGRTLYSLPSAALTGWATAGVVPDALTDRSLSGKVKAVGENGPADGLLISRRDGRMYVTSPQDDSIKLRDLSTPGGVPATILQDARLRWPDTLGEGPDGTVYVTTSRIQDSAFYKEGAPASLPTQLWSFKPPAP